VKRPAAATADDASSAASPAPPARAASRPPEPEQALPLRLLIVEDEAVIALDLAQRLKDLGYEVVGIAASGARALELATAQRPDLVMMDIVIKGPIDGIETARRIRAEIDVPVIFLTAYSDRDTLERVKQVSPFGYLLKPFRADDLRSGIEVARQRHQMEQRLRASERWLASTLHCLADGVIATDGQGRVRLINTVAEQLIGRRSDEVRDLPVHEVFTLLDAEGRAPVPDPIARALARGRPSKVETGTVRPRPDADPIPVEARASPIRDDRQRLLGAVLVFRDITERRRAEAALARLAHLDTLTGLPNRAALLPQLEAMLSNARRLGNMLAVLFVDLDGFKQINDSLGHRVGDELLVKVARRLKGALRVEDFVARLGGDEFVVLAGNLAQAELVPSIARKLIETIDRPFAIDGHELKVTASAGVSLCPADRSDADGLLRHADSAMYRAKELGKNRFVIHGEAPGRGAPLTSA
jgi:diguanylate cyclase (GGDEF)-like protein/PAS domain S-box-containing protein